MAAGDLERMSKTRKQGGKSSGAVGKGEAKVKCFQGSIVSIAGQRHLKARLNLLILRIFLFQASYNFLRLNGSLIQTNFCSKIKVLIRIMKKIDTLSVPETDFSTQS